MRLALAFLFVAAALGCGAGKVGAVRCQSGPEPAEGVPGPFRVEVSATQESTSAGARVFARVTFTNVSAKTAGIPRSIVPGIYPEMEDAFVLWDEDGKELDYLGPLFNLGPRRESQFLKIEPGATLVSDVVDISELFEFPQKRTKLSIRYSALVETSCALMAIRSAAVSFDYEPVLDHKAHARDE